MPEESKRPPLKLPPEKRAELIKRHAAGELTDHLAAEYGISASYVRKILAKRFAVNRVGCENREQSYLENVRWAMAAAGEFARTGEKPTTCPNDACWFLYQQAIDNPKEFMTKVGQAEPKADGGENERALRIAGQRSVADIQAMLRMLEQ